MNSHDIDNETATTVKSKIMKSVEHYKVEDKVLGYIADNAAVNFGAPPKENKSGSSSKPKSKTSGKINTSVANTLSLSACLLGTGFY